MYFPNISQPYILTICFARTELQVSRAPPQWHRRDRTALHPAAPERKDQKGPWEGED